MTKTKIKITEATARAVLDSIDGALCSGAGDGTDQNVCVMQAISRAFGWNVRDDKVPDCVGDAVGSFNRTLNDCNWSTPEARAKGFKRLGIACIGSNQIDQKKFSKLLALKTIQTIVPITLRAAAKLQNNEQSEILEAHAVKCELAKELDAASDAARAASDAARAASYAASDAASYAASDAASYAASDAARAASYAASDAASDAARAARDAASDNILAQMAEIAVQVLIELKSPGVKFLGLCKDC